MLDLPVIQMVRDSDVATIIILCVLALMSLFSWGIIILKWIFFRKNQNANARFYRQFEKVERFVDLKDLCDSSGMSYDSIQHRASLLEDTIQRSIEGIRLSENRHVNFLGMCANLAPFFGLLGTVWGIMSAFFEIGKHGSADLTVVAPGIAMALITTVAGLVVAIPASGAYNIFVSRTGENEIAYYNFGSRMLSLFKRGDLLALEEVAG